MPNNKSVLLWITIGLNCCMLVNAQTQRPDRKIENLIEQQVTKFPEMNLQDIYKFLMQAALGSEHAVPDSASVQRWMDNEIKNLDWNHDDSMIDTLSPDGNIVRVNLRPYIKADHDIKKLLHAFIQTANDYKGSREILEKYLKAALKMIDEGRLKFSKSDAEKYFEELKGEGYPAVHHSKRYEELYSPAYRVVERKFFLFLFDEK